MHKSIKKQLNKCRTILPDWDDSTTEMIISHNNVSNNPTSGSLTIKIENYIINEPANFTLSSNWNNGTKPPEQDMIVDIVNQMGKMYKVSGDGIDTQIHWEGWLPEKGFKVIT